MGAREGAVLSCAPQNWGSCSSVEEAGFEEDVIMATIDKDGVIFNESSTGTPYSETGAQICAPESDGLLGVIHSQTPSST